MRGLRPLPKTPDENSNNALEGKDVKEGLSVAFSDGTFHGIKHVVFYDGELYIGGEIYSGADSFALDVKKSLNNLWMSKTARMIVQSLQKSTRHVYTINQTTQQGEGKGSRNVASMCYWNNSNPEAVNIEGGKIQADSAIVLIHELGHAYNFETDKGYEGYVDPDNLLEKEEEETSHLENLVRVETNKPLRTAYSVPIVKNKSRIYTPPGATKHIYRK